MAIANAQTPVGNFAVTAGTTIVKAYTSNVTAGNLLVALFGWGNSGFTGTVAGSLNGAFTAIAGSLATNASAPSIRAETFFKVAGSSGAETITGTVSTSNSQRELVIYELSGASSTQPDSSHGDNGTSTNPTGTITIAAQPGWIIAYAMSSAGTVSVGTGYTSDLSQNGDCAQHKAYSATGSTSVPFVDASSGVWVVTSAAFNEAAGGGGVVVKKLAAQGVG
jgi:hypothetical protein